MEKISDNWFGTEVTIENEVQYVGEGEDPEDDLGFQMWKQALKEVYENKCKGE